MNNDDAKTQPVDKFAAMNFDQLLSAYAIAYKAGDVDTFKEYRNQIMERVKKLREAKQILKGIEL